jgi:hypothetical protein
MSEARTLLDKKGYSGQLPHVFWSNVLLSLLQNFAHAPKLYSQRHSLSPLVFYTIRGEDTFWLVTEASQSQQDVKCFGFNASGEGEWGHFSLSELREPINITQIDGLPLAQALLRES